MFDCITLIFTLHHAHDILAVIKECKRLLKDNGVIVIVEHDVWSDEVNMLVDLQHRIYNAVHHESNESYYGTYYNYFEWDIIFSKCGMKPVYADRLADDVTHFQRYDSQFICVYANPS